MMNNIIIEILYIRRLGADRLTTDTRPFVNSSVMNEDSSHSRLIPFTPFISSTPLCDLTSADNSSWLTCVPLLFV